MSIKINFDAANNPEVPTFILSKRNGDKIGLIESLEIDLSDVLRDASEISFVVNKYTNNRKCHIWEELVNFRLVYCIEWDKWFEITVEIDESNNTKKIVYCKSLGHAELSQIKIYSTEINTENDIARDNYVVTVLYNPDNTKGSLLHRITQKAPHYTIIHVDNTIKNLQRMFTFNDISIYDAFQEIAEEIGCIFILNCTSGSDGKINRTIAVYDLLTYCNDCGYRGEFTCVCPKCNSSNLNEGYGEDTTIFITSDELADTLKLTTDVNSVKNCFKLQAGDDLMTASIRACNPNGTDYLWYISDEIKTGMSDDLVAKINEYNLEYTKCLNEIDYTEKVDELLIEEYNTIVSNYLNMKSDLEYIDKSIINYSSLMESYYKTIDFNLFLQSSLLPTFEMSDTNAEYEALKCNKTNLSPVAVTNFDIVSLSTANNAVLSMAKVIVDSRYKVEINNSSFNKEAKVWSGNFKITNYSNEEDTAISGLVYITITDDYITYVEQKISKTLHKNEPENISISGLFKKGIREFKLELRKYSLDYLNILYDSCQGCIDVLIEQGAANESMWEGTILNVHSEIYKPYYDKLNAITEEIKIRQEEIDFILELQNNLNTIITDIQNTLNFETFLGSDLWIEFCSFRREDIYENDNYISDGLNNAELFNKANEFIDVAKQEIFKSAELQHSIESTLKNLLIIPKFKKLVQYFKVGNWIRVLIDDVIYKLRLTKININYDDLNSISVEFSDVVKINSSTASIKKTLKQAQSMATSYEGVKRQASQGSKSNSILKDWTSNGLDTTNIKIVGGSNNQTQSWDSHGMLFREYDLDTEDYSPEQIKIINATISMTDDNWNSAKSAFGKFYYYDAITKELKIGFGINGEIIVGKILLGEQLGIYNEDNSLTFDKNGLVVSNDKNIVSINPTDEDSLFNISKLSNNEKLVLLNFNENGDLIIRGDITAETLTLSDGVTITHEKISGLHKIATSGEYEDLNNKPQLHKIATSGKYEDLDNRPQLHKVAISGKYKDLDDTPDLSGIQKNSDDINEIYKHIKALNLEVFGSESGNVVSG